MNEQHYGDDLSLENLAQSASVIKSECLRCFKQMLQTKPYKYLMEYRLQESVILLLLKLKPNDIISAIGLSFNFF